MLVPPETFAEKPPGASSDHGAPDSPARDHPEPGRRPDRQPLPVGNEAALRQAFAALPLAREITGVRQAQPAA
jgi:hypothetical protein